MDEKCIVSTICGVPFLVKGSISYLNICVFSLTCILLQIPPQKPQTSFTQQSKNVLKTKYSKRLFRISQVKC